MEDKDKAMSMDIETVTKVARLARLEMDEETKQRLAPQLSGILDWIEQLNEVDTENVEPLANVVDSQLHLRTDEVNEGGNTEKILSNAPEKTQGYFVVPKVIGEEI